MSPLGFFAIRHLSTIRFSSSRTRNLWTTWLALLSPWTFLPDLALSAELAELGVFSHELRVGGADGDFDVVFHDAVGTAVCFFSQQDPGNGWATCIISSPSSLAVNSPHGSAAQKHHVGSEPGKLALPRLANTPCPKPFQSALEVGFQGTHASCEQQPNKPHQQLPKVFHGFILQQTGAQTCFSKVGSIFSNALKLPWLTMNRSNQTLRGKGCFHHGVSSGKPWINFAPLGPFPLHLPCLWPFLNCYLLVSYWYEPLNLQGSLNLPPTTLRASGNSGICTTMSTLPPPSYVTCTRRKFSTAPCR